MDPTPPRCPLWGVIDSYLESKECDAPPLVTVSSPFRWRFRGQTTEAEPSEQKQITEIWGLSLVLLLALDGEAADVTKHPGIFRFATETNIGLALAIIAGEARQAELSTWAAFRVSLRLPGFIDAFSEWFRYPRQEPGLPETFQGIRRQWRADPESLSRSQFKAALEALEAAGPGAFEEVATAWANAKRAEAQASKRRAEKSATSSERSLTATVRHRWISHALWCRTTKGIHQVLRPVGTSAHSRIDAAITEHGLTSTRRQDHEATIEWAERNPERFFPGRRSSSET